MGQADAYYFDEGAELSKELDHLSEGLRREGLVCAIGLLLVIVLTATYVSAFRRISLVAGDVLIWSVVLATFAELVAVARFESTRKRSEAVEGALSDWLQLAARGSAWEELGSGVTKFRLSIREAGLSRELPFVPNRVGPGLYAVASLVFAFVALLRYGTI